jgi:glutamate synthase domain-containing protein 3
METKNLTRRLFLLTTCFALFALATGSCKKDDATDDGKYFIRFNANGSKVEFTVQGSLVAAFGQAGTQYNAVFTGGDAASNISLQVYDGKAIAAGTFSGYTITGGAVVGAIMGYSDNSGTLYTQGSVGSNASITISEITTTTVRGTFSGTLKASGKTDIVVSQGEFYVWRAN